MMRKRTFNFLCALICLSALTIPTLAQNTAEQMDSLQSLAAKVVKNDSTTRHRFFRGVAVLVDLSGPACKLLNSDSYYYEAAVRINLKNTFFPIFEAGYGQTNKTGDDTGISYKTKAPYARVGLDYNFLKDKTVNNRLFGGVRMAGTSFNYDISDPNFHDPVWNTTEDFNYHNIKGNAFWAELIFGLEAEVWKSFHVGWNVRYKVRLSQKEGPYGQPWYIPGFGTNNNTCFGGSFQLVLDI